MIFDSYRDPETNLRHDSNGSLPTLALVRHREVATLAVGIIRKHGDGPKAFELVHRHIAGLDLIPERINRLRHNAALDARPHGHGYPCDFPDDRLVPEWSYSGKGQCTWGEWRQANRLVMRVALTILLDVPLRTWRDYDQFFNIIGANPGMLPKDLQQKALRKLRPYLNACVTGRTFNIDPSFTYRGRKPWKGYRPNDLLALAPINGGSIAAGDYVIQARKYPGRGPMLARIDGVTRHRFVAWFPHLRGEIELDRKEWRFRYRVANRFPMRQEEAAQ